MYKIYARPGSGNAAVEALMSELGVAHEVIIVDRDEQKRFPESFRAKNPMMQVPALELPGGAMMTESAAMMIYLADLHPEKKLAPAPTAPERAQYLRWMVFLAAAIYSTDLLYFYGQRFSTDPSHGPGIKAKAGAEMHRLFGVFSEALGAGPHVLGKTFSAVDIYAAMLLSWAPEPEALFARYPNLKALADLVAARPAIAPVWKRNEM